MWPEIRLPDLTFSLLLRCESIQANLRDAGGGVDWLQLEDSFVCWVIIISISRSRSSSFQAATLFLEHKIAAHLYAAKRAQLHHKHQKQDIVRGTIVISLSSCSSNNLLSGLVKRKHFPFSLN